MKKFSEHLDETYAKSGIGKWMKQSAGGEPGWDRYNEKGERAGKCGDAEEGDAYSACLSPEKAKKLGKKGIASFVRRKRAAQKKAGDKSKGGEEKKGQKPVFVKTKANEETLEEKNVPLNPALWKKAIAKAKSKFDVYPSAYANAWASKWYKEQGGKWTTKKESVEDCGCDELSETKGEYEGREVDLDNPFRLPQGSDKKFGVYVENPKTGNVIMVKFGDPNLSIKRDQDTRLKSFRSRHNCDQKTDKTTPGYWSCKFWEKDSPVSKLLSKGDVTEARAEDYKLKKTRKEVDKQDGEDDITTQHYDVMLKGKKVGTAEEDDYYGYVDATIHGKTIPTLSGRGNAERQIQKYLKSKRGSKLVALDEAAYGHTLWIDPKGKIHDMGNVAGNTHYQWVFNNFTKYFGKKQPDLNSDDVYDVPMQKGWARIRNNSRDIDVEVDLRKLTRSQKKALRDIVDAGPEYGNKGINRPMYIDVWKKNKTSRAGDKHYDNYEEIVDFLSEEVIEEGFDSLKGWINPKTKKAYTTERMRPYHVEFIVKKPKDFGLTKKQILDHLEKRFDAMDAPDPRESAEQAYQDLLTDRNDIDRGIELLAMKKGWYRVVGGKYGEIAGEKKLNDKQVGVILSMMENEGLVGDAADVYTKEIGLEYYKEFDDPTIHPSVKYYGEVKGYEIQNLIKGKPRGTKRTEIGQTMAMFRGESFEISQLDEAVDPKEMLKIFNGLGKGDTIKVKFKSVMMSASKNFVELVVTSGRRTVGKAKVERIILKSKKNPGGVKYFLYRRGDNVSFAVGDMAAIVDDIQETYDIHEGIKDRVIRQLMKMTPVANAIVRNPNTTHLAVSLLAIPAVNALLKRTNHDNLAKVIDLADMLKDAFTALGAEKDPSMCENRVLKYSQFLNINGDNNENI